MFNLFDITDSVRNLTITDRCALIIGIIDSNIDQLTQEDKTYLKEYLLFQRECMNKSLEWCRNGLKSDYEAVLSQLPMLEPFGESLLLVIEKFKL